MSESEKEKECGNSFKPDSKGGYIRFRGLTIEPGRAVPYTALTLGDVHEICRVTGWTAQFDADAQEVTFEEVRE